MCSYLHLQKNSSKKCYMTSSVVQKKWDSAYIQERRKPQQPKLEHQKRNGERRHQSREINKGRKYEIFGPDDIFPAEGDDRNQKSHQGRLGNIHKKRQELTSKTYMLRHRLRFFNAVVSPTMNYASGTWTLTKRA